MTDTKLLSQTLDRIAKALSNEEYDPAKRVLMNESLDRIADIAESGLFKKELPEYDENDARKIFGIDDNGEIVKVNYTALPIVSSAVAGRQVVVNNNGTGYNLVRQPLISTKQINISSGSGIKDLATITMPNGYTYHLIEAHITVVLSSAAQSGDRFVLGLLPNKTSSNLFTLSCYGSSATATTSSLQTILVPSGVTKCSAETHTVMIRTDNDYASCLRFQYLNSSNASVSYISSITGYCRITSFN